MKILSFSVSGFKNISNTSLEFEGSNIFTLLAPNNFGKSNLLDSLQFAFSLLNYEGAEVSSFFRMNRYFPINIHSQNENFSLHLLVSAGSYLLDYTLEAEWIKTVAVSKHKIISEQLLMKEAGKNKFKQIFVRNKKNAFYLPSPKGRCNAELQPGNYELLLHKLVGNTDLFYAPHLKKLTAVTVVSSETNYNDNYAQESIASYSADTTAAYLYYLKTRRPADFNLLKNALLQLTPEIEYLDPIEINMKEATVNAKQNGKLPFELPERLYDVRVKERCNNQETGYNYISRGTRRLLNILTSVIKAEEQKAALLLIEEPENSIHPQLFRKLVTILSELSGKTAILLTCHSPAVVQYVPLGTVYFGVASENGLAEFRKLRQLKQKQLLRNAEEEMSDIGSVLFDLLAEAKDEPELVREYFEAYGK